MIEAVAAVRARVAAAAGRAGRDPDEITVVAVSKLHPPEAIDAAFAAGVRDVGENYAQEMLDKQARCAHAAEVRWHFIGRLQRNKARHVVGAAALIHAVDSERLAVEIDRRAGAAGLVQPVLVAVNLAGEASKSGVSPEQAPALIEAIGGLGAVECQGLMTMPPLADDPEQSREFFRGLRRLAGELRGRGLPLGEHLSMGTTGDYPVAIEEGATLVRIGTAIFGARPGP